MFPRATADAHYSPSWWTALYKSSSRSPTNALLNKTCMSDVARQVGSSIRITCRVTATKERKSINWNLSQNKNTTFQGIPTVNIRQPGDCLIENRALAFREWGRHSPALEIFTEIREFWSGVLLNKLPGHVVKGAWNRLKGASEWLSDFNGDSVRWICQIPPISPSLWLHAWLPMPALPLMFEFEFEFLPLMFEFEFEFEFNPSGWLSSKGTWVWKSQE